MKAKKRTYHGWILVEDGGTGYRDYITVEWSDENGRHSYNGHIKHDGGTGIGWRGQSGAARAVEWWEEKLGKPVKLEPALKGSYRVLHRVGNDGPKGRRLSGKNRGLPPFPRLRRPLLGRIVE